VPGAVHLAGALTSRAMRRDRVRGLWQGVATGVLLSPVAAWASDMCELGAFLVVPPSLLVMGVALLVGAVVESRTAAGIWLVVLGAAALPAFLFTFTLFGNSFHDSRVAHPGLLAIACGQAIALVLVLNWTRTRLVRLQAECRPAQEE
jgi:hypothetical protein